MSARATWQTLAVASLLVVTPSSVFARSAGLAAPGGCSNCHSGGKNPTVTLTAEPANPAVGQAVLLTIAVSQTNGTTAGFYLMSANTAPGAFQAVDAGTSVSSTSVMHSAPRAASGGTTTFKAQWTATRETGVAFDLYAVSANGDRTNRGDGAGEAHLQLLVGCTGATYYIDQDGDGHGSTDPAYTPRKECEPPAGYAPVADDCDDFQAPLHPGAAEQCDLKDNDCDGVVDNDVVYQPYCADQDGDGYGVASGATKTDCKPSAGFGDCVGDCDDREAATHPSAAEVCDGRDNDCDGQVDEGAKPKCGVGLCARYAERCSSSCIPGEPFAEACDGYDNDCDGVVDNGSNETLCGDAGLSCVLGHCTGTPSGSGGTGPTLGEGSAGSSAPIQGLNDANARNGCSLGYLDPQRPAPESEWLTLLALAVSRRRRVMKLANGASLD